MTMAAPSRSDDLKAQALGKFKEADAICAKAQERTENNGALTETERNQVKALFDEAKGLVAQADEVSGDADLRKALGAFGAGLGDIDVRESTDPADHVTPGAKARSRKSLGEQILGDPSMDAYLKSIVGPGGTIAQGTSVRSPGVQLPGLKAIITGTSSTSGGALVQDDVLGLVDATGTFQRPLTARDLITNGTTGSDTVEFARVTGFTNAAAPVAEASGTAGGVTSGDVAGTKPQSDLTLEKVTATVRTIAHWVPVTKRALADAGQIRTMIDNFLRYGLEEEVEDQIINGVGTGENFTGILQTSGRQSQAWDTDLLVTTRKAKTKVRTVGRATPTAYLLNPADNERIDLTKDDNGGFYFGGPAGTGVQTLWGLPRIECEAVPSGVGIVADWRQAVIWDREDASVSFSDSHADFFVRNLVAILAELRAAFGVLRPKAFVEIDLTA